LVTAPLAVVADAFTASNSVVILYFLYQNDFLLDLRATVTLMSGVEPVLWFGL